MAYEFRPRSVGEMVDAAFRLYRSSWWTMAKTVGMVLVPAGLIIIGAYVLLIVGLAGMDTVPDNPLRALAGMGYLMFLPILGGCIGLVASMTEAAIIAETAAICFGEKPVPGRAWRLIRIRFWRLLGAAALGFGLYMLSSMCCSFVGTVIISALLTAMMPAIIVENSRTGEAFTRSFNLIGGGFWRAIGVKLVISMIIGFMGFALLFGVSFASVYLMKSLPLAEHTQSLVFLGFLGLLAVFCWVSAVPILAISRTLVYFDLRVRKEGFDLTHALDSAGRQEPDTAGTKAEEVRSLGI